MVERRQQVQRWVVLGAITACFLYPFAYFERLNNPNEHVRLYMTMAMVEEGTYAIDGPSERYGWVNDRAEREGHLYAGKAPGASLLGVPVYALARWIADLTETELSRRGAVRALRLFTVTLPCLLLLWPLRRFLDDFDGSPWLRDAVLVAYALGSMAYAYGMMFAGHQPAAAALTGALIALYRAGERCEDHDGRGALWRAAVGGLLLGVAPAMEYPAAVGALVVFGYAVAVLRVRPGLVALVALVALLPALPVLHFHWSAFGSPLAFPYDYIENPAFQRLLGEGWHGATFPQPDRLATMLVAPSFGLLFFTPLFLLAPVGWVAMARKSKGLPRHRKHLAWVVPATTIALVLYLASSALWRAGWAVGPRYIATAVPMLALASLWGAEALHRRWREGGTVVIAALVLLSVLHSGTSGALYPHQPEPFDNPVYDLNVPLLAMGFAPHTAAEWLGLVGWPSLLPLALAAAVPLLIVSLGPSGSRSHRVAHLGISLLLALLLAGALSSYGEETPAERRLRALVVRTWEPRGHSIPEGRIAEIEALGNPSPEQLRQAAHEHARLGHVRRARALDRRAESLSTPATR